jgi:predicted nucleic acid-binding Zn ribbon protein
MASDRKKRPERLGDVLAGVLKGQGISDRIDQAAVIPEWPDLVGKQIARVTEPRTIAGDGTLFVSVTTNAWMTELSLLEPELLKALNGKAGRPPIKRLRWQLKR